MKYKKPNFLIVGAAKSGTTSLAKYLSLHEDIFIPTVKEPRFFISDIIEEINVKDPIRNRILETSILNRQEYFSLFDVNEKLAGEASVHYLFHFETVIPKIKKELGDIPIIILLRNPVNRLISNYEYMYNLHYNSLEKELQLENNKIYLNFNSFWYYKELGLYTKQVKAYLDNFSKVKIVFFEEFVKDLNSSMIEVFNFLEVKPMAIENIVHNQSQMDSTFKILLRKSKFLSLINPLLSAYQKESFKNNFDIILNRQSKKKYPKELMKNLTDFYKNDIKELESILGRSLRIWH